MTCKDLKLSYEICSEATKKKENKRRKQKLKKVKF